jgi:glutamate N-acetyltransferase/amino-acid N-acetyltransferase|tara:strand:+ start:2413 stop:3588 length:1176 start_codon:yes stop_codon:yes gene_type:complete
MTLKVTLQTLNIGIKKNKHDAVCLKLPSGSITAMVTTKNKYAAAPVILSKKNLLKTPPKYLLINSGNANACTGRLGAQNSLNCTKFLSKKLNCNPEEVLLFSTGVIGRQLPINDIKHKIANNAFEFKSSWESASKAIMTTDKFKKFYSKSFTLNNTKININAICKGAGMIEPNMATMLAFICIDAKIKKSMLNKILKDITDNSFNSISVDGDMSTNDSVVLISTGEKNKIDFLKNSKNYKMLVHELTLCCQKLSKMIIQDGEGATKVITINIHKAKSNREARLIAYKLANSNLIKTAMFGADPNWGRIIAKLGSIENINYNPDKVQLKINNILIFKNSIQSNKCNLKLLNKLMKNKEVVINLLLNSGNASHSLITSDLTHEYVHINSAYTT